MSIRSILIFKSMSTTEQGNKLKNTTTNPPNHLDHSCCESYSAVLEILLPSKYWLLETFPAHDIQFWEGKCFDNTIDWTFFLSFLLPPFGLNGVWQIFFFILIKQHKHMLQSTVIHTVVPCTFNTQAIYNITKINLGQPYYFSVALGWHCMWFSPSNKRSKPCVWATTCWIRETYVIVMSKETVLQKYSLATLIPSW